MEAKDIRKAEIPETILQEYRDKLKTKAELPHFWGGFIEFLISHIELANATIENQKKSMESLDQELEIRTSEYHENKIAQGIIALQEAGFKIGIEAREK